MSQPPYGPPAPGPGGPPSGDRTGPDRPWGPPAAPHGAQVPPPERAWPPPAPATEHPYGAPPVGATGWGPGGPPAGPVWPGEPGAAGPGSPGGPARSTGGAQRAWVIGGIAAGVVLIVAAVLVGLALGREDDTQASASSDRTLSPATVAFLATLPTDFDDCGEGEAAGDGDTVAAQCGAAGTQPGPETGQFFLYPDAATLGDVFSADAARLDLAEFADGQDCSTTTGYTTWTASGDSGGSVGCAFLEDDTILLFWTDEEYLTEGVVTAPGSTQADLAELFSWWDQNAFFE